MFNVDVLESILHTIARDVHTEGQSVTLEQFVQLGKRFLTKVTELEQVSTVILNEFAKCLYFCSLLYYTKTIRSLTTIFALAIVAIIFPTRTST